MLSWRCKHVEADDLPPGLSWSEEAPRPDYTVHLAFARSADATFRRVTFPDGSAMFAQIERVR
jgi:hypothetical protein